MNKTMSIRMDRDNYEFLHEITKAERSDLSKAVRDLVTRGRLLLAVERYKKGEASLGRAAELAGLPLGQIITILTEFGVESRLEKDDYLQRLRNLHKVWWLRERSNSASTSMLSGRNASRGSGHRKSQLV
jgi:predicted HTH domain antitoxin